MFLRTHRETSGDSVRVIMVDLRTGQSADLFGPFEAAADPPTTPAFSADGTKVLTGRRLEHLDPNTPPDQLQSSFTETDVTNFPAGPFPHTIVAAGGADSTRPGRTLQPTPLAPGRFAFAIHEAGTNPPNGRITVRNAAGATTLSDPPRQFFSPTISHPANVVVFQQRRITELNFADFTLVFRSLSNFAAGPTVSLPGLINAPSAQLEVPEFSPDGRYLAFIRRPIVNNDFDGRLFVWDTQTQLLLNPNGHREPTGVNPTVVDSGLAVQVTPVFRTAALGLNTATFTLAQTSRVGILVQRIVGTTRVLGRRAPKLRLVGRVPLGTFKRGAKRHRAEWDGEMNGRKLPRGEYLLTLRALTSKQDVRDLSKPARVRVR